MLQQGGTVNDKGAKNQVSAYTRALYLRLERNRDSGDQEGTKYLRNIQLNEGES